MKPLPLLTLYGIIVVGMSASPAPFLLILFLATAVEMGLLVVLTTVVMTFDLSTGTGKHEKANRYRKLIDRAWYE
ncbi:MAG: hypothetical protein ABR585_12550 [Gemmatimonadaceae bacterium]|nr:hypothetical protein [Actinomycetota bacterium]